MNSFMDLVMVELFSDTSAFSIWHQLTTFLPDFLFNDPLKMERTYVYFVSYFMKLVLTCLHDIALNTL